MEIPPKAPTRKSPAEWFTGDVSITEGEATCGERVTDAEYHGQAGS